MTLMIVGLVLFLGVHMASVIGLRDRAVTTLGEGPWKGLYSVVAIIGFLAMVYGFAEARAQPELMWAPPVWTRHLGLTLMVPVFPLLLAAYLPGRVSRAIGHPMVLATILWAASHLVSNGMVHEVVFFGAWLAWAVIDFVSLRVRPARPIPTAPPAPYNDVVVAAGGLGAYAATLFGVHQWLFGVAPLR